MSVCDNKTKIYPDPNPSAPQEPQAYWLNKLSEIEAYFFGEIEVCEQNAKKNQKRFNTITGIVDISLITSAVINGGISTTAFASGVGLHVAIALDVTSLASSLVTCITRKISKTLTVKQKKTRCY